MLRKGFFFLLVLASLLIGGFGPGTSAAETGADAVVLVNSASSSYYPDFQHYIQPYLDNFGIPYAIIDISTTAFTAAVKEYAVIIVGHRQLDPAGAYLDSSEQAYISAAVNEGTGLVNFDNDLSIGGTTPRYSFVQDVFGFGYGGATSGSGVAFPSGTSHYITERHQPGETIGTKAMSLAGITLPGDVTAVANTGTQPFLAITTFGGGRAVQWGSYNWMSTAVKGPIFGLDDLVWRSIVWTARKPFVMRGLPPFVTMRVDDESGGFEWIHIANEFGVKPWAGIFLSNISDTEAADLSALVNSGNATTTIHSFTDGNWFYWNQSDAQIAANFAYGTQWHTNHNIPISKFVVPHYYQFTTNAFQGLKDWGVKLVGTMMNPGEDTSAPWIMNGPYRLYETGPGDATLPVYYADFIDIPGHLEFNRQFFNCITEIRDEAGYEWYPDFGDVSGSIGRGTRQTKRALDSMALATLFAHSISGDWDPNSPANWRAILQGITDNLRPYNPIYVTMDYACQYVRATRTSHIVSATYDPTNRQVTANLDGCH
jgi:hypothetical protein